MIILYRSNIAAFAGSIRYLWIGQLFINRIISGQGSAPAAPAAANWTSNYDLLRDIIE